MSTARKKTVSAPAKSRSSIREQAIANVAQIARQAQDAGSEEDLLRLLEVDLFEAVKAVRPSFISPSKWKAQFYDDLYRNNVSEDEWYIPMAREAMNAIVGNPSFPLSWFKTQRKPRFAYQALGLNDAVLFAFAAQEPDLYRICALAYDVGPIFDEIINKVEWSPEKIPAFYELVVQHVLPIHYPQGVPPGFPTPPRNINHQLLEQWSKQLLAWFERYPSPRQGFNTDYPNYIASFLTNDITNYVGNFAGSVDGVFTIDLWHELLIDLGWAVGMDLIMRHIAAAKELARIEGLSMPLHPLAKVSDPS